MAVEKSVLMTKVMSMKWNLTDRSLRSPTHKCSRTKEGDNNQRKNLITLKMVLPQPKRSIPNSKMSDPVTVRKSQGRAEVVDLWWTRTLRNPQVTNKKLRKIQLEDELSLHWIPEVKEAEGVLSRIKKNNLHPIAEVRIVHQRKVLPSAEERTLVVELHREVTTTPSLNRMLLHQLPQQAVVLQ